MSSKPTASMMERRHPETTHIESLATLDMLTLLNKDDRQIAEAVGNPAACRAVGMANHCNPIPFVIPCHRVVGTNGSLTGYAGGIEKKIWLLRHEGVNTENLNRLKKGSAL